MAIRLGTNGNNRIIGTAAADLLFGFGGDDAIDGGAGNDFIFGGAGSDVLNGGLGADFLDGGSGADQLIFTAAAQAGRDVYNGGAGIDALVLELTAAQWADAAVKADVSVFVDRLAAGVTAQYIFASLNLAVAGVETLALRVDGVIVDPREEPAPPSGQSDFYMTDENGVLTVLAGVAANDDTGDGTFTVTLESLPERGILALNADGTFTYDPGTDFEYLREGETAVTQFVYRIANGAGTSDPVTVDLSINGVNDAPVISGRLAGQAFLSSETESASGKVDVADPDDGESGVIAAAIAGEYGSFVIDAAGQWTYTISPDLEPGDFPPVEPGEDFPLLRETIAAQTIDGTQFSIAITVFGFEIQM